MKHCPTCQCEEPDGPWVFYMDLQGNAGAAGVVPPLSYTVLLED